MNSWTELWSTQNLPWERSLQTEPSKITKKFQGHKKDVTLKSQCLNLNWMMAAVSPSCLRFVHPLFHTPYPKLRVWSTLALPEHSMIKSSFLQNLSISVCWKDINLWVHIPLTVTHSLLCGELFSILWMPSLEAATPQASPAENSGACAGKEADLGH